MRALLAAVAAASLLGCARMSGTKVQHVEGATMAGVHRVGVLPFRDERGQGVKIADAIEAGLRPLLYETAERKPIERALAEHKPDQDFGLSLEAYETIRRETGADAIVTGRMSGDWTSALMSVYETEMGDPVLRAVLKPRGKGRKRFETPDEVAAEALSVLGDRR